MTNPLRERLAALEHDQWAHWTEYMLNTIWHAFMASGLKVAHKGEEKHLGDILDLVEDVQRWRQQIKTPYTELSEREKDSDREWADKVLALISQEEPMMVLPDGWIERAEALLAEVGVELPVRSNRRPVSGDSPKLTFTITAGAATNLTEPLRLTADGASSTLNMQWPDEEAEPDPEDRDE